MRYLTDYSVKTAQELFDRWSKLDKYLLIKYMDGNVKSEHAAYPFAQLRRAYRRHIAARAAAHHQYVVFHRFVT